MAQEASGETVSIAKADEAPAKGSASSLYNRHAPKRRKHDRKLPDLSNLDGMKAQKAEAALPSAFSKKENKRIKEIGLDPVKSIEDKTEFSCFQRGSPPHWSGINTFLKVPYLEDVRKVGEYDVAFVGVPFDIGYTFRTGTRFGPQGSRRISALYQKYSYEHGVDLSETLAMCDVGDISGRVIPPVTATGYGSRTLSFCGGPGWPR
jgi:agmatinase